jgi:uncharacterized delta-60 repeat protein
MAARGHAYPGGLDETFGGLSTNSVGANVMCHAMAPDGKIVLAGNSGIAVLVARRLSNNQPDNSFGGHGSVVVTNLQYPIVVKSVAVQPDGKIVIGGYADTQPATFLVARVTAFGQADPTFSGDGFATADLSVNGTDQGEKVLIQPDGKIILVGSAFLGGDWDFAAARFNTDGTLDATFSGDGKISIGFGGNDLCYDAVLQADGKLVMVGGTEDLYLADKDFAVARLHPEGSLDGSFDDDGILKTGFGDSEEAWAVAIQPTDLRIVVAGRGKVARYYSSDGELDDSFDGDGKLSLPARFYDAAVTPGGQITLIGISDGSQEVRIYRRNPNGSLDPYWQTEADVIIDDGVTERPSFSLLPDGRVLTVVPKGADCIVKRWWADGILEAHGQEAAAFNDITFGPGSEEIANDMAVLENGEILLAGHVATAGGTEVDFALVKFLADGRLDKSFGVNGRAALSLGNRDVAKAMVVQPDGKIVVAGYTGTGNAVNFMIARFNPNGSLDNNFGFGGFNAIDFMGGPDYASSIALQPDGRIIVAGTVFNGARNVFGVARFRADGVADNTFDTDAKQLYEFSVGPTHWGSAVLVQGSGRIIVGGHVGADFALVAFTPAGAVDFNFASPSGRVIRNLGGDDYLQALVMGTDGRIYAAGTRVMNGIAEWALTRWPGSAGPVLCNPVCPWTTTFVNFGSVSGWVDDLDVRGDGHLVIGGTYGENMAWAQFAPGAPTNAVGGVTSFPGTVSEGLGVRFSGASHVVLAGYHLFQGDRNMTVARFETAPNTTVAVEEPTPVVTSVRLEAPSPNPLIGRSTFAFELPRAQSVHLAIHDASGRLVRTIADGALSAGRHQRQWDATDNHGRRVPAGIYFARLVGDNEQATASIVVLR